MAVAGSGYRPPIAIMAITGSPSSGNVELVMRNQIPAICELESELEDIVFSACGKRLFTLITGKFQVFNALDGSILPGVG